MDNIRSAQPKDISRIAEIEIFNYRLYFYPIFKDDGYYFEELNVLAKAEQLRGLLDGVYVYDDGAVKGFARIVGDELEKLFVEPVLHGNGIGARLLEFAAERGTRQLWALEKNERAINFYRRHGFSVSDEKKYEEGTTEILVKLVRV